LSSLRIALNAAEPVRYRTIVDFERTFGLGRVMIPGYGLAEATVGVSTWRPGVPVLCDERGIVCVGKPFDGILVEIVVDGKPAPAGVAGEIMVRSPANTSGYFNSPEETADLFWRDDYVRTGDLGYLDSASRLYVTGRAKNIIKHCGETIFPQEVEQIADAVSAIRQSAALGVDRGGAEGEQLYLFAELRKGGRHEERELQEVSLELVQSLHLQLGMRPGRVYLLKPRAIPKTHNGKIRYSDLRELYLSGRLREAGEILYPEY